MSNSQVKINHFIKAKELRVIGSDGSNLGVLPLATALAAAEEANLDLIEISPSANPPVAKIMDFGKYQYLENKKAHETKTSSSEVKKIQVKIGTGDHDLEIKAAKVSEFLGQGHRVKINLFLPGRAKYLDPKFLEARVERLLKFVSVPHQVAEAPQKGPKGLTLLIEKER